MKWTFVLKKDSIHFINTVFLKIVNHVEYLFSFGKIPFDNTNTSICEKNTFGFK